MTTTTKPAPTHWTNKGLSALPSVVVLGDRLHEGDTIDYFDDGTGSGGYVDGCGDVRDWDDIRARLRERGLRLADNGGGYEVGTIR